MKQFVKKYIPYNKRNQGNNNTKQTNQQNKSNTATSQNQAEIGSDPKPSATPSSSKVNKIELDAGDDMLDNLHLC